MKAVIQARYGPAEDVLSIEEVAIPDISDEEVLVRVRAASVHADIWHVVTGFPFALRCMGAGFRRPKQPIPGTDFAGIVDRVGSGVQNFRIGDEVFGESHRGHQWCNGGTFAEYVSVPHNVIAQKPTNVTFEQAAAVPTSGIIALQNLENGKLLESAQNILINGAAGGVGSIAVQYAKSFGLHVTAVDATGKLDMLRSLGADEIIDYTKEDFTKRGDRYDIIFDVASNLVLSKCKHSLTSKGLYILIGHNHYGAVGGRVLGGLPSFFKHMAISRFDKHLPSPSLSMPKKKAIMAALKELLASGKLTPMIDRSYPLCEAINAMHRLQSGNGCGKIVLTP